MAKFRIGRRGVLLGTASFGAGLLGGGAGLRALAQDADLPLPEGSPEKLTVIHRTEYFQEAQDLFADAVRAFAEENGKEVDISTTIPEAYGNFLGKMSAAVRAGNPPDIAYTSQVSIPQMHVLGLLEDVTDVVEEAKRRYGDFLPGLPADSQAYLDGAWRAIPFLANTTGSFIRGDKLAEAGIGPESLKTLDDIREAALAISDPDNDFWGWGITPNQGGDGFSFLTLVMNNFGGSFTDESGQVVTFDSPETLAAMEWIAETYDRDGKYGPMLPPGIESWTDASNNEAFLAGNTGYTRNAFSVYASAKREDNPVFDDILILPAPATNDGRSRDVTDVGGWLTIFKGAPNAALAKELALELLGAEVFDPIARASGGLFLPAYQDLWTDDLLAVDPNFPALREQFQSTSEIPNYYWPAQPNAAIDAIRAQGTLEQVAANIVSGRMTPAEAVADGHRKMVDIFEQGGIMQP